MSSDESKRPRKKRIITRTYRGPDRREDAPPDETSTDSIKSGVTFDGRGNAVWEWKVDAPRRRLDDPTIDFLKALDIDTLEIAPDEEAPADPPGGGYDPYARVKKGNRE